MYLLLFYKPVIFMIYFTNFTHTVLLLLHYHSSNEQYPSHRIGYRACQTKYTQTLLRAQSGKIILFSALTYVTSVFTDCRNCFYRLDPLMTCNDKSHVKNKCNKTSNLILFYLNLHFGKKKKT